MGIQVVTGSSKEVEDKQLILSVSEDDRNAF